MPKVTIHDIKKQSPEIANWLFEKYPGFHLDIPKKKCSFKYAENDERDAAIYKMHYDNDMSFENIAKIMDLEVHTIRKIVHKKYYNE